MVIYCQLFGQYSIYRQNITDSQQIDYCFWGRLCKTRPEVISKPPLSPNPPEADKFLCLPCEMRSLFLWGWAQGFNIRNIKYMDARPDLFNRGD
jgi:hypothetical protein